MPLVTDYFLLYHGKKMVRPTSSILKKQIKKKTFFEISILILSVNRKNYEKYVSLENFHELISQITDIKRIHSLEEVHALQYALIENIKIEVTHDDVETMHQSLSYLKKEKILHEGDFKKLVSLFDVRELVATEKKNKPKSHATFLESKVFLENTMDSLEDLLHSVGSSEAMQETKAYMDNQKFSIGITGVINAGKSTMLNALMGQNILGSSVVPETANLTIVKYGEPEAKVIYWSKKEWDRIEKSALEIPSMKDFVEESRKAFGDEWHAVIKEKPYSQTVDISDLASYTSSESSEKRCNLVKEVVLQSKLNFLANGIEIVDTPGLDDPVIQREEITKEYIAACDLMMHLMNVSQSATQKDIEFIVDALLYQNITKLLVVITRADTVTKEQLEEVIAYTKSSIKQQLKIQNKEHSLDAVLESLQFIPISGKMALLHRTGEASKAEAAGFRLEDTGILEIEAYLNETLFGKNSSKSELIVQRTKKQISQIIIQETGSLHYTLELLSKTEDELEATLVEVKKEKKKNIEIFNTIHKEIDHHKNDIGLYVGTLEKFLTNKLQDLRDIIKERVFSNVKYSYEKTKKKPKDSQVKIIIETAIKDGIIDIVRDYRHKFMKKTQVVSEIFEEKYQAYDFVVGQKEDSFDAMNFFQNDFKIGFLTTSNEVLITKILDAMKNSKSSKLLEFDNQMQQCIKEEFSLTEERIQEKSKKLVHTLADRFFHEISQPLIYFEKKLTHDEAHVKNAILSLDSSQSNRDEKIIEIHKKIKKLETIKEELVL